MIKRHSFIFAITAIFLLLSGFGYFIHYLIFRDVHHIFIYLIGDLAFLPLEVLLVVVVIEGILTRRETQAKMQKLNMVVGAFFSEVGNFLLQSLLEDFHNKEDISRHLNVTEAWTKKDFQKASDFAYHLLVDVNHHSLNLIQLNDFLSERREFLLALLENPSLLENDRFTDLLWAVTHLDEELEARVSLSELPEKDLEHIAGDIQRMYDHLAREWLDYVAHLKLNYPYLFSLILRTHPFQEHRSPIVS
ncbi:MAG: hypothetical protein AAB037_03615 [Chloroflexota bacterium]